MKSSGIINSAGFTGKIESYTHSVGHCYRCDTVVEPYLSDQWFVKMEPLAGPAIEVVEKVKSAFNQNAGLRSICTGCLIYAIGVFLDKSGGDTGFRSTIVILVVK